MKENDTLLLAAAGVAAYFLLIKPKTAQAPVTVVPASTPGLPAYVPPVQQQAPAQSLITQAGNALTSLVNNLTGNVPTPSNQIVTPVTPPVNVAPVITPVITPTPLPVNIPSLLPAPPVFQQQNYGYQPTPVDVVDYSPFDPQPVSVPLWNGMPQPDTGVDTSYYPNDYVHQMWINKSYPHALSGFVKEMLYQ